MTDSRQEKIKSYTLSMPSFLASKRKLVLNPLATKKSPQSFSRRNSEVGKLPPIVSPRPRIESWDCQINSALDLLNSPKTVRNSPSSSKYLPFIYAQNGLEKANEIMPDLKLRRDFVLPITRKDCCVNLLEDCNVQAKNPEIHKRHRTLLMQSVQEG
ncbi:unnamed protein product [Blepharisma stoltei]|uniref:Uncharacterized protein n=1 Tax=Blepharisma stoltei TaxID=1481888 RepID=A0AAU9IP22_9CILI|nr:unnamed protein product [Blepharisma stoltei]